MFFRIAFALFFSILTLSANAQDIRSVHPISDVYVAQFQYDPEELYWMDEGYYDGRPSGAQLKEQVEYSEEYAANPIFGTPRKMQNPRAFKVVPNGVFTRFYILVVDDPSIITQSFDANSDGADREFVSKEFLKGNHLYACSNMGSDYRLYAFRRNPSEVFLWQNFMIPRNRTYFHIELEEFNRRGSFYLDLGRGRSNETYDLPGNRKFRLRDVNQCYGGSWVAMFNNSKEFSGRAFTFQARDLALLWDKIQEYRRDGIYLVDIEKGDIEGSEGGTLWYAVFSDNDRFKTKSIWKVFLNHDDFVDGVGKMRLQGYGVTDLEISSRGSIKLH